MMKILLVGLMGLLFVTQVIYSEELTGDETILADSLLEKPFGYTAEPLGYRETPPGWREFPIGYREVPLQFRETPLGYREEPPNTLAEPRGFRTTPPNYVLREEHHLANNDESLKQSVAPLEESAISDNFRDNPPGYQELE